MKKAFKLVSISNIPIEINFTWFIVLGLIIFTLARGYFPLTNPNLAPLLYWLMAAVSAVLLFASLLAHELSHALVAKHYNIPIHSITLFIFGGVAQMEKEPASPGVEFQMAIAGPILSFFLSFIFFCLTKIGFYIGLNPETISIINYLFVLNFIVASFNLIPGFPLDGGRILRSAIWYFSNNLKKATAIATGFGKFFAYMLIAFGFIILLSGAVVSGVWLIFIGLFLQESADFSYKQLIMKKMLSGIPVGRIMAQNVITIPANIKLDALINDYFFRFRHAVFPIMEHDNILGIVTFHDIKEVAKDSWSNVSAQEIMKPINRSFIIDKDTDIMHALTKLASNGLGRALVVENKKLIGIVSQRDIMRMFELKAEIED